MSENSLQICFESKVQMYRYLHKNLLQHLEGIQDDTTFDEQTKLIIGLSNASSLLFYVLNGFVNGEASLQKLPINWLGFYLLSTPKYLSLGPFQGKIACTKIKLGKGVCGTAALLKKTELIPNVHEFPGHIECDSESKSELVVPIRNNQGTVVGLLDIDSTNLNQFDQEDVMGMTECCVLLGKFLNFPTVVKENTWESQNAPQRIPPSFTIENVSIKEPLIAATLPVAVPTVTTKTIDKWTISCSTLNRILSRGDVEEYAKIHKLTMLPEALFPMNALILDYSNNGMKKSMTINALEYLICARDYCQTKKGGHHDRAVFPDDAVSCERSFIELEKLHPYFSNLASFSSKKLDIETIKLTIDWMFRSNFIPKVNESFKAFEVTQDPKYQINYENLRKTDLEILFYDSFDIFDDDLHDLGISRCNVKFRVMPTFFFILVRHVIRLDSTCAVLRDLRFYHEYSGESLNKNVVVAEISHKGIELSREKIQNALQNQQQHGTYEISEREQTFLKLSFDELQNHMKPLCEPIMLVLDLDKP